MNDDLYNSWRRRRADVEPSADFTDRVMAAVRQESPRSSALTLWSLARVAACVLACLACLYRMAAVVAVFYTQ